VEALFASSDAGLAGAREPASLDEVMAALLPGELLVEYCLPADSMHPPREIWALVATRETAARIPLGELPAPGSGELRLAVDGRAPIDFFGLNDSIAQLRRGIEQDDGTTPERLEWAYRLLVQPILDAGLDPELHPRWIVVPDGVLHAMPFAALRGPDGRYLGERVALTLAPSASVWLALRRDPPSLESFLGLADPRVEGLPELPDARRELVQVCRLLRNRGVSCEACMGAEATESWLKRNAGGRSIVHVAAHGDFPPAEAVDLHELRLAPEGEDDGRVHAYELRRLDLEAAALAVLSVCDSGTYRFGPGDELHGMAAALLLAGARDVVATLWPIEDALGTRFVTRFYGSLLPHGPAEALRRTRAELIRQGVAVREWAAFVGVGSGIGREPPAA
jgi:CHAT domain-containing protein